MTLGENIRRLRKERKMTLKELGSLVGVSESYMRAYEVGDRHPKPDKIEKIAIALGVNPETLQNAEFDSVTAMHRIFQIFRSYNGELSMDKDGNISISFATLQTYFRYWHDRYKAYQEDLAKCDQIKDPIARANELIATENAFIHWMDTFPQQIPAEHLEYMNRHDKGMDYVGLHPLNDPEAPMTEEEKKYHSQKAKELFSE
ncbi:MAG: helix-turn-helix domain-containing protein [Acetatifactor sp.]|nr:helix-turn-helix domain-containing protein [Acetatifactor sp.]